MTTVLVIDDDVDIREMLDAALTTEGYAVVTAANGKAALDRLADMQTVHQSPCLILLDLMMPVMNGVEFLSRLQSDPALSPLPVVVMSAFDKLMRTLPPEVKRLAKPLDLGDLLHHVETHCGSPSA
jgi:CheY-like chemotaxis protein